MRVCVYLVRVCTCIFTRRTRRTFVASAMLSERHCRWTDGIFFRFLFDRPAVDRRRDNNRVLRSPRRFQNAIAAVSPATRLRARS